MQYLDANGEKRKPTASHWFGKKGVFVNRCKKKGGTSVSAGSRAIGLIVKWPFVIRLGFERLFKPIDFIGVS
jgi:hypothetical protein